jgi:probable phosphoglycerate mutase
MQEKDQTRVLLVRHGETVWNVEGRLQGHQDSALTEMGVRQAQAVAERLASLPIAALYASDLGRCVQTANYIAERIQLPIVTDSRLRERHNGLFEGLTEAEAAAQHPDIFAKYRARTEDLALPGGESVEQALVRGWAMLEDARLRHAGECTVLVSHGGLLSALLRRILGVSLVGRVGFSLLNGSISVVIHDGERWLVRTMGDICHL